MANLDSTNIIGKLRVSEGIVINGNSDIGSATQPIYFDNGIPKATTYTLSKSVPSDAKFTDTTYSNMTAATSSAAGKAGLVPAPAAGKQGSFLRGDGTWATPTDTKVTQTVTSSSNTSKRPILLGMSYSDDSSPTFTNSTNSVYASHNMYVEPSSGVLHLYKVVSGAINSQFYYANGTDISTIYAAKSYEGKVKMTPTTALATSERYLPFSYYATGSSEASNIHQLSCQSGFTYDVYSGKLKVKMIDVISAAAYYMNGVQQDLNKTYCLGSRGSSTNKLYFMGTSTVNNTTNMRVSVYSGTTRCYIENNRLYSAGTMVSPADYAEFFEWADGNLETENRLGLFVSFSEECPKQIRIATPEDEDILGIVSAQPAILGNCAEDEWIGKYQRDIWGRVITETIEVPATYDEEGNEIEAAHTVEEPQLSADFDPTREYIPRGARAEWAPIGLLGVLVMQDDGTCIAGCYCKCGQGGKATFSTKRGWRVLERLDETHIKVYFK